jgi:hypothetical protein
VNAATIIGHLDRHQGASATLLTLVLVAVTCYYAVQNRRMAIEMRRGREAAVRPKLALDLHLLGPTAMTVAIKSVGSGVAFDVRVRLVFAPLAEDAPDVVQHWQHNVLPAGDQHDLLPPGGLNDNVNGLPASFRSIRLTGTMQDANGISHTVDECIADLGQWRKALGEAHQRYVIADADRRLADAFGKRFDQPAKNLVAGLEHITQALHELREPQPEHDPD